MPSDEPRNFSWLVAQLASESSDVREDAAAQAAFWSSHLTDDQNMLLSRLISGLVSVEPSAVTREAQLNALLEIFAPPRMTRDDIAAVLDLPRESFTPSEQQYIADMLEQL